MRTGFAGVRHVSCGLSVCSVEAEAAFLGKNCMPENASVTKLPGSSGVLFSMGRCSPA